MYFWVARSSIDGHLKTPLALLHLLIPLMRLSSHSRIQYSAIPPKIHAAYHIPRHQTCSHFSRSSTPKPSLSRDAPLSCAVPVQSRYSSRAPCSQPRHFLPAFHAIEPRSPYRVSTSPIDLTVYQPSETSSTTSRASVDVCRAHISAGGHSATELGHHIWRSGDLVQFTSRSET